MLMKLDRYIIDSELLGVLTDYNSPATADNYQP